MEHQNTYASMTFMESLSISLLTPGNSAFWLCLIKKADSDHFALSVNSCFGSAVTFGALCKLAYGILTRSKRPCHWCLLNGELSFILGMTDMIFTLDWSSELLKGLNLPWLIFNARDVAGNLQPAADYLTSLESDSLSMCRSMLCNKTKWCHMTKKAVILHQFCTSLYFTICSPFSDPTCLMAFTGEIDYREWKHSGDSQSRHRHPLSLILSLIPQAAAEKKQPKSFCCNISPRNQQENSQEWRKKNTHIQHPSL